MTSNYLGMLSGYRKRRCCSRLTARSLRNRRPVAGKQLKGRFVFRLLTVYPANTVWVWV